MSTEKLPELNLGHLRVLLLVAQLGSITRAAAQLFRAQSAVTRSIQEVERVVGEVLLERHPAGVSLTPVGDVVVERTRRVFVELETLAQWCAGRRQTRASAAAVPASLLNTRRLMIVSALARSRHMPSAALLLGVTQPAVSSAIRILESDTGFPIFTRATRGVRLTEDGETFVLHVRRALNELRHVRDDIAAAQGHIRGHVAVGALPLSRTTLLPKAIALVHQQYPGVQIATDESAYESLVASLLAGDIDLILGALRPDVDAIGLQSEYLISVNLAVLVRSGHPLMQRQKQIQSTALKHPQSAAPIAAGNPPLTTGSDSAPNTAETATPNAAPNAALNTAPNAAPNTAHSPLSLRDLTSAQWILPRSNAPARANLETLFIRKKLKPPVPVVETADLAVIRGLLLATDMIAAIPAEQLQYECDNGTIAVLDIVLSDATRQIGITTRAGSEPSAASRAFIDALRSLVAT